MPLLSCEHVWLLTLLISTAWPLGTERATSRHDLSSPLPGNAAARQHRPPNSSVQANSPLENLTLLGAITAAFRFELNSPLMQTKRQSGASAGGPVRGQKQWCIKGVRALRAWRRALQILACRTSHASAASVLLSIHCSGGTYRLFCGGGGGGDAAWAGRDARSPPNNIAKKPFPCFSVSQATTGPAQRWDPELIKGRTTRPVPPPPSSSTESARDRPMRVDVWMCWDEDVNRTRTC